MILLLSVFVLAGCASTMTSTRIDDEKYMSKVEYGAKLGGAQIIWVNPPQKEVPVQNNQPVLPQG
jgi:hypothetical protein